MHRMHFTGLDLNLLKVLDALLDTLNVTQAALRIGLSPSATSHALQRLRSSLDDPLFVRTSAGLQPTPYALGVAARVKEALRLVDSCLQAPAAFDPATTSRTFTLFITDIGDVVLLPPLLAHLREHAPLARLRTLGSSYKEIARQLETGNVDIAVTVLPKLGAGFYQQTLFRERYVCIVRRDHPGIGERMTAEQFRQASHALVTAEGTGHEVIEQMLDTRGLSSRVVLRIPHFLAVPTLVAQSDLVATVPRQLALAAAANHPIRILEHPLRLPAYGVNQFWHERLNADLGHRWLRSVMVRLFKDLAQG